MENRKFPDFHNIGKLKSIVLRAPMDFLYNFWIFELEIVSTFDSRDSYSQSTAHIFSTRRFIQKCTITNVFLEMLSYESSSKKKFVTVKFFIKVVVAG